MTENRAQIIRKYRAIASLPDALFAFTFPLRRMAVQHLGLSQGGRVLDMGCGSGASFPFLMAAVGPTGQILGVDISPEMIAAARRRVEKQGWQNVELRVSAAEDCVFESDFDGILLFAMHDVLTSGPALDNLLRALKPGGMLVAIGPVTAQGFPASLLNPLVRLIYRRFAVAQQDIDQPWHQLQARLPDLMVERHGPGILYLVHGRNAAAG